MCRPPLRDYSVTADYPSMSDGVLVTVDDDHTVGRRYRVHSPGVNEKLDETMIGVDVWKPSPDAPDDRKWGPKREGKLEAREPKRSVAVRSSFLLNLNLMCVL